MTEKVNTLALLKQAVISLCLHGLSSENKQESLEAILQCFVTDKEFEDMKRRDKWPDA